MRTIIPCYFSWKQYSQFNPTYDSFDLGDWLILQLCTIGVYSYKLHIMPPFTPNYIMLEKHADKGKSDWEIYAWCLRDVMSKQSGLKKADNIPFKDKNAYCEFMMGRADEMQVQGRTFKIGYTSALDLNFNCNANPRDEEEEVVL